MSAHAGDEANLDDLADAYAADAPTLVRDGIPARPEREGATPRFQSSMQIRKIQVRPNAATAEDLVVRAFVTVLGDDQIELGTKLRALLSSIESTPFDPSACAVGATLHRRVYDVAGLRDALDAVYLVAFDRSLAPLYDSDAPLGPFLKGLYIWADGVLDALAQIATELRSLDPSWACLRLRLAEASQFFFDGLVRDIQAQVERLRSGNSAGPRLEEMSARLEELVFAARWLARSLEQRFG